MSTLKVGDRVRRDYPGGVKSAGVITELTPVKPSPFIHDPGVPGAIVQVESGPYRGQIVPFELSGLALEETA